MSWEGKRALDFMLSGHLPQCGEQSRHARPWHRVQMCCL